MTPYLPFGEAELAVMAAEAAHSRSLRRRSLSLDDQLVSQLIHLKSVLEQADRFGPSDAAADAYLKLRGWFMSHYAAIRELLRANERPASKDAIATWSLESVAADRIYGFIAPSHIYAPQVGWRNKIDRLIREAKRVRKAVRN